jgi:hypothetical protein
LRLPETNGLEAVGAPSRCDLTGLRALLVAAGSRSHGGESKVAAGSRSHGGKSLTLTLSQREREKRGRGQAPPLRLHPRIKVGAALAATRNQRFRSSGSTCQVRPELIGPTAGRGWKPLPRRRVQGRGWKPLPRRRVQSRGWKPLPRRRVQSRRWKPLPRRKGPHPALSQKEREKRGRGQAPPLQRF